MYDAENLHLGRLDWNYAISIENAWLTSKLKAFLEKAPTQVQLRSQQYIVPLHVLPQHLNYMDQGGVSSNLQLRDNLHKDITFEFIWEINTQTP